MSRVFNDQIKYIRKANKFTQIQFAKILNISQGNLSEIESGKIEPSLETVVLLCKEFNLDFNKIINSPSVGTSSIRLEENEAELIYDFRQLEAEAKEELLDFVQLKLKRYKKNE